MTRARFTLAIAFGALAFTACGGGGSDDGDDDGGGACEPTAPGCSTNVPPVSGNTAPTAKANGPYTTVAGGAVSFTAAGSSDAEDQPSQLVYAWDFGDGSTGSGAQVSHTYTTAKTYTARLKVTDTKGATANDAAEVTVTAAPAQSATTGTMAIQLTDAPFPFDSVQSANMAIVRVDARIADPTAAQLADLATGTDPNAAWVTVATGNPDQPINLLELQGGKTVQLGAPKTNMPIGSYAGFRIVLDVTKSNLTLRSNTRPTINWGGTGQLAFKIVPTAPVALAANGVANVLVDFDLGRSFIMKGATPSAAGFDAAPSLKALGPQEKAVYNNIRLLGSPADGRQPIEGATVELLVLGTAADDFSQGRIVATGRSDAQGLVSIANVLPGNYAVRITPPQRLNYNTIFIVSETIGAPGAPSAARAVRFSAR